MSIVKYLSIALVLGGILCLAPWVFVFHNSLSQNPADWAAFGSYLGGAFASFVAALALIALLYTIYQQHQQILSLRQQKSKSDVVHAIENLERDLEKALDKDIQVNLKDGHETIKAKDLLFKISLYPYVDLIPRESEITLDNENDKDLKSKIILYEIYGMAAAELNQIRLYLVALQKLEKRQETNLLTRYYDRKYELAAKRLYQRGLLKTKWEFPTKILD